MKAIVEYSQEEIRAMDDKFDALKKVIQLLPKDERFERFVKKNYRTRYEFSGVVSDKLVETLGHKPTPEEVIMIIDNGYWHFGACCRFITDTKFTGYVNTD